MKAIRQVYKYALDYEIERITLNPTRDVPSLKSKNLEGFHPWPFEEIKLFEDKHPVGTEARMVELGLSDFEIMANGGWTTLKEVQRYTKIARK